MAPSTGGGMNFVSPLKTMGLRINLSLNALASIQALGIPSCRVSKVSGKICRGTRSRLRLGVFRLTGKHLRRSVKLIRTWLQRRRGCLRVALILTVGGRECQITPPRTRNVRMWKPHQLPLTRIGFNTAYGGVAGTWQMTSTTLTSRYSRGSASFFFAPCC